MTKSRNKTIHMTNKKPEHFDVIIIGGGPAGMSASLWCRDLGLTSMLIEQKPELGGQLLWTYNKIENYLGISAENGRDLCDRFVKHLGSRGQHFRTNVSVLDVDLASKRVILSDGTTYSSAAIIIATGVRRRKLGIPGEAEFEDRGMLVSGAASRHDVAGKAVLILGGGDSALENALILSEHAKKIYVVHRRRYFSSRQEFVQKALQRPNIEFITDTRITSILGTKKLEQAVIDGPGGSRNLPVDHILVRIGVIPNSELFAGQLFLDNAGYVITDSSRETSFADVYAVGDVSNPRSPTISTAAGSAVTAIKSFMLRKSTDDMIRGNQTT